MSRKQLVTKKVMRQFVDYDNDENSSIPMYSWDDEIHLKQFGWVRDGVKHEFRVGGERLQLNFSLDDIPMEVVITFQNLYAPMGPHSSEMSERCYRPNRTSIFLITGKRQEGWEYFVEPDPDTVYLPETALEDKWSHEA